MGQWSWCFIVGWSAELACVMLCFVGVLVFCCVAGGKGHDEWSNNTSLKDSSWGSYNGTDRTERCESCLGAPFSASGCLLSWHILILAFLFGIFPSFMFKIFFGILNSFFRCVHVIIFCFVLIYLTKYLSSNSDF